MRFKEVVKSGDLSDSSSSSSSSSSMSNRSASRLQLDSDKFGEKNNVRSNTAETCIIRSSDSDSGTGLPIERITNSQELADLSIENPKTKSSPKDVSGSKTIGCSRGNHKRRVQDELQDGEIHCFKKRCDEVISEEPADVKIKSLKLDVFKDSGFSSSSSQERSPTEEEKPLFDEGSSQEIYSVNQDSEKMVQFLDIPSRFDTAPLKSHYSTLSQISCISADSVLGTYKDEVSFEYKSDRLRESQSSDFGAKMAHSESNLGVCMFCLSEPKNSVFVHSNFVHLCCCYKCAVKVWKQRKACPICNCKVKNVMKLFVH